MNNSIQNMKVDNLIPSSFHDIISNKDEDLETLEAFIKNFGILDPLIVRPKGNKYEIILGNKRYKVATKLGITEVPVTILNLDDKQALELILSKNTQTKELTKEKLPALKDFDDTLTKEEYVSYIRDLMTPTHNTLENHSKEDDLFKEMSFAEAISSYAINKEEVKEEEKEIVKEETESISNNLLEEPPKVIALETKEERINREIKDERQANFEAYILKLYEGIDENRKRIGKLKYKVLQEELLISSEVDYYNECVKKIKCFTKEATRLEKISPKNLNDVYENLNIPNRDMSIEEIYDYLSHDEKYAFTDMKEIRKPILSIGYNEMSIEKQEEPKEKLKKEPEVRPESQFVPNINSLFVPKMNTKMYTDYTFAEETRPLFVTEGPCSIKEIDFKDSEGKVYSAFSELDSLEYQNKGYKAFAISKNPYEYYRLEDVY